MASNALGKAAKQVIVVRRDLNLSTGKTAAQVAHGSLAAILSHATYRTKNSITLTGFSKEAMVWLEEGFTKIVLGCDNEGELQEVYKKAKSLGLTAALITDAGYTEVAAGTHTVCAVGPDASEQIDKITGGLKLL